MTPLWQLWHLGELHVGGVPQHGAVGLFVAGVADQLRVPDAEVVLAVRALREDGDGRPGRERQLCTPPRRIANVQVNGFEKQIVKSQEKLGRTLGDNLGETLGKNSGQKLKKLKKALEVQTKIFKKSVATVELDSDKRACCFACGKPGHMKRDCPTTAIQPKQFCVCPCCRKGKHRAKYCHSQFDINGKPLS